MTTIIYKIGCKTPDFAFLKQRELISLGKSVKHVVSAQKLDNRLGNTCVLTKILDRINVILCSRLENLLGGGITKSGKRVKGHSYLTVFGKERIRVGFLQVDVQEFDTAGECLSDKEERVELFLVLCGCLVTLFLKLLDGFVHLT